MASILRQLLNTFDQKLYYGNVRVSKIHPTIEKLYRLYSFWINYSYVAKLDYYITLHIPLTKHQVELFDHLGQLIALIDVEKFKYARIYYNLNVSEVLMHDYPSIDMIQVPKLTIDGKLQFVYIIRKILSPELLESIKGQCETCKVKPISGLSLKRNLK